MSIILVNILIHESPLLQLHIMYDFQKCNQEYNTQNFKKWYFINYNKFLFLRGLYAVPILS